MRVWLPLLLATACLPSVPGAGGKTPPDPKCVPLTCQSARLPCGTASDGCGGTMSCGTCPDLCANGTREAAESDVDCGGKCAPCALGKRCLKTDECFSGTCEANVCVAGRWSRVSPMPTPRSAAASVLGPDGRIYVLGGHSDLTQGAVNTVEAYSPELDSWTRLPNMVQARYGFGAVLGADGRIYAVGGQYNGTTDGVSATAEVYSPDTRMWTLLPNMNISRYWVGVAAGLDGRIYAVGGFNRTGAQTVSTAEVYSPDTNSWTYLDGELTTTRCAHAVVTGRDGRIYALGGSNSTGDLSAAEVYFTDTALWNTLPSMNVPRAFLAGAVGKAGLYAFGGAGPKPDSDPPLATVELYSPEQRKWTRVASMPEGRMAHSAVAMQDGRIFILAGFVHHPSSKEQDTADVLVFTP